MQLALLKDLKKTVKRLDDGGSVSDMPDDPRLLANFDTAYPNAEDPPVTCYNEHDVSDVLMLLYTTYIQDVSGVFFDGSYLFMIPKPRYG